MKNRQIERQREEKLSINSIINKNTYNEGYERQISVQALSPRFKSSQPPSPKSHKKHDSSKKVIHLPRQHSPSISLVPSRHGEFIKSIEDTLLGQNKNLKEHNTYLYDQVKTLFHREGKFKQIITKLKLKNQQLKQINNQLLQQIQSLTVQVIDQIQKIQSFLQKSFALEDKGHQAIGWQTQSTIHHNLQQLRHRITNIYNSQPKKHHYQYKIPTPIINQPKHRKVQSHNVNSYHNSRSGSQSESQNPTRLDYYHKLEMRKKQSKKTRT